MGLLDNLRAATASSADNGEATFAPAWRWELPGDGVEGVIVAIDTRAHDNHPDGYPIVTLRQADGTDVAVHGFVTVLKNEINEKGMQVGGTMAAIYDGKRTSGSGRQFHAFRVAYQPGDGTVPAAAPAATRPPVTAAPVPTAVADPWQTVPATNDDIPPF